MRFLKENYLLILIVAAGFALRVWGVDFGLPYQAHQDEPIVVNHALAYGTGDLNPHFFIIPPLTSYLLFLLYGAYFLLGSVAGAFGGVRDFAVSYFADPTPFYIIGRSFLGVLPGTLNILLTYFLCRKLFSRTVSLYAAFVMAVSFINVVNSHYIYTDSLMVMFVLLSYLWLVRMTREPSAGVYAAAGAFIGLASATKYNAAVLAVSFVVAHLIARAGKRAPARFIVAAALSAAAAFIATNPFSVIDGGFFLGSLFGRIRSAYMGWTHHIFYSLFEGTGYLLTAAGISGLFMMAFRKRPLGYLFVSFPAVFYLHLALKSQPFPRYVLPLMPFLSAGAAFLFFRSFPGKYFRAALLIALAVAVPTFVKSVKADMLFSARDTREYAAEWIEENVPASAKIALDHTFFGPGLRQTRAQIEAKRKITGNQPELKGLKDRKFEYMIEALEGEKTYEVYFMAAEGVRAGEFLSFWPVTGFSMEELRDKGIEYVVFNNMDSNEEKWEMMAEMNGAAELAAEFNPYYSPGFRKTFDEVELTGLPAGSRELYSRERPGPYIVIYELR
ncbi:MAG: phospholipid carrier-dependent glycosyltransferase [Candidatus Omnitrophica bacterium]|nr:phospholipid carrier-dependent glycosyltransferase [Candidatus Omnitrophota bacterium]